MDIHEAIETLKANYPDACYEQLREAVDMAISALQAQDSKTRKICDTCKHDQPSKKWPCMDCDMREPADRWEPNECQTCKHYDDASEKCGECLELGIDNYEPNEMENSNKSSLTQKGLDVPDTNVGDMVNRQWVIDELKRYFHDEYYQRTSIQDCINCFIEDILTKSPFAQPEPSTEIQEILNYLDTTLHPIVSPDNWYVYAELHDMVSMLPSAQSEHTCVGCKHYGMWENEVEYGYNSPCTNCKRRMNDNYEQ